MHTSQGMSSPNYDDSMSTRDLESGYASASSSQAGIPDVYFSKPHLKFINQQLQKLEPEGMFNRRIVNTLTDADFH